MSKSLDMLKQISVLIAEDDEMARSVLVGGLKPYCGRVYGASDAIEGLDIFKSNKIDIIITDIHMPNLNGFEMMKEILSLKPTQKFIVFTSYDTDINLVKSIEAGATLFLKKPIDIQELRSMLISLTFEKNEKIIQINKSISINLNKEKIFKDGKEIYLTFLQNKFFWLFAYNLNKLVTYDMIENFVYDAKGPSKGAIQNVILRLKKELGVKFKNISESGYILVSE
ncbi:response regulator transcription factor [Campylobacter majalis]|uniref:response regulator transcription factor n=1 Tax=Campylobacter majalis TaxID=2790656 RepID=UPI001E3E5BF0|nr:response regulator [Campylobacter majalis]